MEKLFKKMMIAMTAIIMVMAMTACGPDEPDGEDNPVNTPPAETLKIDEAALRGTWYQGNMPNYGNEHYISFDAQGNGELALCADQFANAGFDYYEDGFAALVKFTYTIDGDKISITPVGKMKPFVVQVQSQESTLIRLSFPSSFNIPYKSFEKFNSNPRWFSTQGPASVDLTVGLEGRYKMDSDFIHKFTVTKVNDYTLTIVDEYKETTTTGQLYWREKYNPSYNEWRSLNSISDPSNGLHPFYEFSKDGKLYIKGIHEDCSATKITDEPTPDNKSRLAGTSWRGTVEYDTYIEITFGADGTLIEVSEDEGELVTETGTYIDNNGSFTFFDAVGTLLYVTFGGEANYEFSANNTKLKIFDSDNFSVWNLNKK